MANHFGFLDSQEEELNRIGLEIYDVSPGRYLEIDLNIDRTEPQRVYPYGRFDTITVLNPQEIIEHEIWIYINRPYLENRYPLNQISRMETKGNEIYLQHEKINAKLKLLVGGDARAFKVDPINKDNSVTDLGLLNDKAKNIQDYTEILKDNSEINTTNIGQINVKQNAVIQNLEAISGKDFATQTTLAQVKSELELVKAELQAIKANQLSGDQKVQLSGTIGLIGSLTLNDLAMGPGQIYSSTEEWEVDSSVRKIRCFIGQGTVTPTRAAEIKVYVTHRVSVPSLARELVYETTDKGHAWGFLFEPPFPSFGLEIMCVETDGYEMLLRDVRMWEVR